MNVDKIITAGRVRRAGFMSPFASRTPHGGGGSGSRTPHRNTILEGEEGGEGRLASGGSTLRRGGEKRGGGGGSGSSKEDAVAAEAARTMRDDMLKAVIEEMVVE